MPTEARHRNNCGRHWPPNTLSCRDPHCAITCYYPAAVCGVMSRCRSWATTVSWRGRPCAASSERAGHRNLRARHAKNESHLWRATSFDHAVERAEAVARAYAAAIVDGPSEYVGFAQAYHLYDEPPDGAEVFSLFRVSDLEPEPYLDHFFDTGGERQQELDESP